MHSLFIENVFTEAINEAYGNGLDTISNQDTRYSLDGHRDSGKYTLFYG
jgi:hypothetical protein